MNDHAHNDELLGDVLAEGRAAGRRAVLLGDTLRQVRRRRRFHTGRRWVSAFAVIVAAAWLLKGRSPATRQPGSGPPYQVARTVAFPPPAVIQTTPFPDGAIVRSHPSAVLVTTVPSGKELHELTDEDLLALAPNPAILVRHGPDAAELVFAQPVDDSRN
jgi:hypothetical protein